MKGLLKKRIAILLSIAMAFSSVVPVFANDESLIQQSIENDKDMVKTTMEKLAEEIEDIVESSEETDGIESSESTEKTKNTEETEETENEDEIESIEGCNYETIIEPTEMVESTEESESEKEYENMNPPKINDTRSVDENDDDFEEIVASDSSTEEINDTEELVDDDIIEVEDSIKSSLSEIDTIYDYTSEVSTESVVDLVDVLKNVTMSVCVVEASESDIIASVSSATISDIMIFGSVENDVYYGFLGTSPVDYSTMYLSNIAFDNSIYGKTGQYINANQLQGILSVELKDLVKKVVIMNEIHPTGLFQYFYNLQSLEVISCEGNVSFGTYVKTDSLTDTRFDEMFKFCQDLRQVGNVANVIDLDIDTSQVTSMEYMFYGVGIINATFDLCTFDTGKVTNMDYMFQDSKAKTIYASPLFSTSSLTTSIKMFDGCISLEGSEGTRYDSTKVDAKMAHIDMYYLEEAEAEPVEPEPTEEATESEATESEIPVRVSGSPGYFSEKLVPRNDFYYFSTGWCMIDPATVSFIKFAEVNNLHDVLNFSSRGTGVQERLVTKFMIASDSFPAPEPPTPEPEGGEKVEYSGLWCVLTENPTTLKSTIWVCAPKMNPRTIIKPICTSLFSGFASLEYLDISMPDPWNQNMQFTVVANAEGLTNMEDMFGGCATMSYLNFGQKFDTRQVTSMMNMFQDCANLRKINFDMDTESLENFSEVFERCVALTELTFGPKFNAQKVTTFEEAFNGCALIRNLDISMFSFAAAQNCAAMFTGCNALTTVIFPANITSPNLTRIDGMFMGCSSLTNINFSGFDTSNVIFMDALFMDCISLQSVIFGEKFKTTNVSSMNSMFMNCPNLRTIDLSRFDTKNVAVLQYMFASCSSLESINLENFDTSNAYTVDSMFASCSNIRFLDLTNFNTNKVYMAQSMFQGCINLETINVSNTFVTSAITLPTNGADMFLNCYNLRGGAGTTYDPSRVDFTYARVDGGVGNEGYFTGVPECKIGSTNYPSLENAIANVTNGQTITMLSNKIVDTSSPIILDGTGVNYIIDFAGNTLYTDGVTSNGVLSLNSNSIVNINNVNFNAKNNTTTGYLIKALNGTLNINGINDINSDTVTCMLVNGAIVNVNNADINIAGTFAVHNTETNSALNISGGKYAYTNLFNYSAASISTTITGGSYKGSIDVDTTKNELLPYVNTSAYQINDGPSPYHVTVTATKVNPTPIPYHGGGSSSGGGSGRIAAIDAMINKGMDKGAKHGMPNSWLYDQTVNKWYRIGPSGVSIIGWFQETNGAWFFMGAGYEMQEGYNYLDGAWYCFTKVDNEIPGMPRGTMYANQTTPDGRYAGADGIIR